MKNQTKRKIASVLLLLLAAVSIQSAIADQDTLYVGDTGTNTVARFNAGSGQPISGGSPNGVYVAPSSGGLYGPRGMFTNSGRLFVANQNVNQPFNGEVLVYKLNNGAFEKKLVAASDAHSPYAPQGMVSWKGVVYVADFTGEVSDSGKLLAFDEKKGTFLGDFTPPAGFAYPFHPRGLVIGENGLLYVSNVPTFPPALGGQVLVFDPETFDFIGAFVSDAGGVGQLNRPEGIVFSPDGDLYITSFRGDPSDTDSIRIYDGSTGVFKGKIELYASGQPRAYAQVLLFGPDGKLFVPITGPVGGAAQGEVRRYNVTDGSFDVFARVTPVPDNLGPWYLTFGRTDPGTLTYDGHGHHGDRD